MEVVTSFRCIFNISRVFGLFPYVPEKSTNGHVLKISRKGLLRSRVICVAITLIRVLILFLDLTTNYFTEFSSPAVFRTVNTLLLYWIALLVYKNIVKRGQSVCDSLNKVNEIYVSLNADAHQLVAFNRLIVAFSVIFFFATNTPTCVWLWTNAKFINGAVAFIDSLCFISWLAVENLYLCQFLILTNVTRVGFRQINKILLEESLKYQNRENLAEELTKLRVHHLQMTDFYDFLNSHFGLNLFFYIFWSFSSILFCAISVVLFDLDDALTLIIWSTYHPCQNIPIIYMCSAVSYEAKKAVNHLHNLLLEYEDQEVKEAVELFSLQLQHRPADFNVCGFYNLDFPLLHSMVAVVTTYIIALLQVPLPPAIMKSENVTLPNF